jgi:uncharacterized lipoprotein YddW (UPF0748 family)
VEEAAMVVDRVGDVATPKRSRQQFDQASREVDGKFDALRHQLMAARRRDLLVIAIPQFAALTAILLGVGH